MKKLTARNKLGFAPISLILIVILIAGASYTGYRFFTNNSQIPQLSIGQKSQDAKPRSKAPGIITQVVMAKGIDQKTGEAVDSSSSFSKKDKNIYVVLTLKDPKVGTRFEYTRYLNGKFLDNGSLEMKKAATNNVSFNWMLKKPDAAHLAGSYVIKVYTNGVFEKETQYKVK